jgi:hypothetical protein
LWVKKWAADVIREQFGIPDCRSLIRLDKEVRRAGQLLSCETRYFISSIDSDVISASEGISGYYVASLGSGERRTLREVRERIASNPLNALE